jgi:predicted lactoylglutathione lyase
MFYCDYDYGASGPAKYFCDVNNTYYSSLKTCYNSCGFTINNNLVHMSMVDMTFIFALWAVLLSIAFFMAFHISHD